MTLRFGGLTSLDNVSLTMTSGSVLAVIGPNGAGKTSLFNCLTGRVPPAAGQGRLPRRRGGGVSILDTKPHNIAQLGSPGPSRTSGCFRPSTALENVQVASRRCSAPARSATCSGCRTAGATTARARTAARALLDRVGLRHRANIPAAWLPYGEQRRLEIARALGTGPSCCCSTSRPPAPTRPRSANSRL